MENILYHQVQAENVKNSYKEYDTIDFILSFEDRALITNSVRFEAEFLVNSSGSSVSNNAVRLTGGQDCYIDPKLGGHSVCSSITTQFQNSGVVENLTEYPRSVKMRTDGTQTADDMMNSNFVCELRAPHKVISQKQILQKVPKEYGGGGAGKVVNAGTATAILQESMKSNPDFSIVPNICVNKVVSQNQRLDYQQSGAIKISIVLERNTGVLWGRDVDVNYNYELQNVKMCFMSAPSSGKPQPVQMINTLCLKSSLTSAVSNISSKVPAVCNSMTTSYLEQSREYSLNYNNNALAEPPNIKTISYMFNDSFNQFVSFEINNRVEMLRRGLESLSTRGKNSGQLQKLSCNDGFITGLNWNSYIDLSNQKFNININSNIDNTEPYIMFSYFHSIINV